MSEKEIEKRKLWISLIFFLLIGIFLGGVITYSYIDKTKIISSRNFPKRLICDTCISGDEEWIYCKYDTGTFNPVETPSWCEIKEEYIQIDLYRENRLYGVLDWNVTKEGEN